MFNRLKHLIIYFFKYILKGKFYFKNPTKSSIVIFDSKFPGSFYLNQLLFHKKALIFPTRAEEINELYISLKIITFIIKNYFKRSIKQNYLLILIQIINPKLVITYTDNSPDFYIISKFLKKKIRFIAFQQASREHRHRPQSFAKKIFIPEYHCLSQWDKDYLQKKKANIKKFIISGSLKVALAERFIKKKNIKIKKNKYDICIIGEAGKIWNPKNLKSKKYNKNFYSDNKYYTYNFIKKHGYSAGLQAQYAQKFCEKNNLKFIIIGKHKKNSIERKNELFFYEYYLGKKNFRLEPGLPTKFSSYKFILQSKLIIGNDSTLLREALALNKKILHCNLSGNPAPNIPIKKNFSLQINSFKYFEKKVSKIFRMSNKEYFSLLGKNKDYIIANSRNLDLKLIKRINSIV